MSRHYIFREMSRIQGYMDPCDALSFQTVLEYQNGAGLRGGGAEIGVYYGRSYFLIRKLIGQGDKVFAADLFNIGERADGSDQLDALRASGQALGLPVSDDLIHRGDSADLTADTITKAVGPVRFFSVDGGHKLDHLRIDAAIARDALADHGVIVFDDVYNHTWPEVAVGVFEFLGQNKDFAPFAITPKKLYVCRRDHHAAYHGAMAGSAHLSSLGRIDRDLLGDAVVVVEHPIRKRILYELAMSAHLPAMAERLYPER
ncbi:MAG: class I SAM-dependent methyltransferase [Pseudomonadota bacterium]